MWWIPLAVLACSTVKQDCPRGQICAAEWDEKKPEACGESGKCEALPAPAELELSLPVPAGERVFCAKGNLRPATTHSACNSYSRFAFDWMSPAFEPPHLIVAAADGVAYYFGGCPSSDLNRGSDHCNGGNGNFVRIEHQPNLFSQYAHLSAILVHWGQWVKRGQPIGIEGDSGLAGTKHLHFSVHRGDVIEGGSSVPITRLRIRGKVLSGDKVPCGNWPQQWSPDPATALVSETALLPAPSSRFGFSPSPSILLPAALSKDAGERDYAMSELRRQSDNVEARYWLGVALLRQGQLDESRAVLTAALTMRHPPRWMAAWIHLRLAETERRLGHKADAARELELAQPSAYTGEEFEPERRREADAQK